MESDANSAFERKFSSRVNYSSRVSTRENPPFPLRNQVIPESPVKPPTPTENLSTGASAIAAFHSPFLTPANVDNGSVAISQSSVITYFQRLQSNVQHTLADQVTPLRLASHLSVLAVAAVILILSQTKMPNWSISLGGLSNSVLQASSNSNARTGIRAGATQTTETSSLTRSVIPNTLVTDSSRQEIQVYTVKSGDTVLAIAAKFGLQPETIMWANSQIEQDPDRLSVGDQINILPVNGILHLVKQGETLSTLADKYKVKVEDIVRYKGNHLANATAELGVGSQLVIPGGVKEFVQPTYFAETTTTAAAPGNATKGFGTFSWPSGGTITQQYWGGHPAIDIASWTGAPVKAADSGYVALASSGAWNTGYGNYIIIDHGNGFTTLYAHLSSVFVKSGENVTRGEQIGLVGSTGHSTGPHLHFEVRYQGVQRNPSSYLP